MQHFTAILAWKLQIFSKHVEERVYKLASLDGVQINVDKIAYFMKRTCVTKRWRNISCKLNKVIVI